ncbi:MAG: UbiA family prenyltransferase, partial [Maribacter sp.]|nr:UbiA family prenyltransferase [Maribacter sp.]
LTTYFVLNFFAVIAASYVSFRAVFFFSSYIFGIWIYSHKLKKIPFLGNFISATLAITPFFIIFVYYKNIQPVIFVHALFLFLLILAREMIKDLENISGDLAQNYRTIPIIYGSRISKLLISFLILLTLVPSLLLIFKFDVGYMNFYFMLCVVLLVSFIFLLFKAKTRKDYVWLHNILKLIIVMGVFGILLIDVNLVLNRIL